MSDTRQLGASIDAALARAVLYRLSSHALLPPDPSWLTPWNEIVEAALEAARTLATPGLAAAVQHLASEKVSLQGAADAYNDALGHTPCAAATPYETEWLGAAGQMLQYHQIGDVSAYYRAFGLKRSAACHERPDHLAVELSFMHFLCVKEAWAEERGDSELLARTREGQRGFFADHVSRWAGAFARRLGRVGHDRLYGSVGIVLMRLLESESDRFSLPLDGSIIEPALPPAGSADVPFECGREGASLQGEGCHGCD